MAASAWAPPAWATLPARSPVSLEVRRGADVIKTHDLSKKKSFVLGRQAGATDIHIPDEAVSRVHAALVHREEKLYIIDLKSAAGVTVNGQRIKPNEATLVSEGSHFVLGATSLQYVVRLPQPPPPPAAQATWEPPAWAIVPSAPVIMHLEEGGRKVRSIAC